MIMPQVDKWEMHIVNDVVHPYSPMNINENCLGSRELKEYTYHL